MEINERTLKAKQYIADSIQIGRNFNRAIVMDKFKISDTTYYKALRLATNELNLCYEDYLENVNMSHPGHACAGRVVIVHVETIDPSKVNGRFDTLIKNIENLEKEMTSELNKQEVTTL